MKHTLSSGRRAAVQALRFAAHLHGASLLTVGTKDKTSQTNLRSSLTSHLFRASPPSARKKDASHDKPVTVSAGRDTL